MANTKKELSFEEAMARLEEIARSLEDGSADLDSALALYEEGIACVRRCGKLLDEAEKKIKMLQTDGEGNVSLEDFEVKDEQ